jgi:hypothetical protein
MKKERSASKNNRFFDDTGLAGSVLIYMNRNDGGIPASSLGGCEFETQLPANLLIQQF